MSNIVTRAAASFPLSFAGDSAGLLSFWMRTHAVAFLLQAVVFLGMLLAGRILIRRIDRAARTFLRDSPRVNVLLENFLGHLVSKVLWVILALMLLRQLRIDIAPLLAGFGVTGFIAGFAFQDSLANLASGMMLALNSPFQTGDYVEIAGVGGTVRDVNMMAVTLVSPDNKRIVIPNKEVWGACITNYTAMETRRVDATVSVAYGADLEKTRKVLRAVVEAHPLCLSEPAPTVEVMALDDSAVRFVVRPWVKTADYWSVMFALQQRMKEALDQAGIAIPFPQLDVHLQQR